ncbi:hypothetical protein SUDANB25_01860 [Streptomyces sp. SudanB25_2051]
MFNRIRRAASLARARYFPKGRHRRPLTPHRPPTATVPPESATKSTTPPRRDGGQGHQHPLAGEEVALVRPYLLAWEERVRTRSMIVAPHLPADACSTLLGAHG